MIDLDKNNGCCFTGHRVISSKHMSIVRQNLRYIINKLYLNGIRYFISGGALGFDTEAAMAVLEKIHEYPDIKLIMALPCRDQDKLWNAAQKAVYADILGQADKIIYISDRYSNGCMMKRNRFMIDNSNIVASYVLRARGGAAYTVNYAKGRGKTIIDVLKPDEDPVQLKF